MAISRQILPSDTRKTNLPSRGSGSGNIKFSCHSGKIGLEDRLPGPELGQLERLPSSSLLAFVHPPHLRLRPRSSSCSSFPGQRAYVPQIGWSRCRQECENGIAERDVLDGGRAPGSDRPGGLLDLHQPEQVHQGQQIEIPADPEKIDLLRLLVVESAAFFRELPPGLQALVRAASSNTEPRSPTISARPKRSQASNRLKYRSVGLSRSHCAFISGFTTRRALAPVPSTRVRPEARSSRFSP